jgi:translocation and assembly module TamA
VPLNPRTHRLAVALLGMALFVLPGWASAAVEITLDGISGPMQTSVRNSLSLERDKKSPLLDRYLVRRLYRKGFGEIRKALRPFGYYQAEVVGNLTRQDETWQATYRIRRGPPVRVTKLAISIVGQGDSDKALRRWRSQFPLKVGDILDQQSYEQAKDALQQIAQNRGYFQAQLQKHEIRLNPARLSAEIELVFATGPRYRFGKVHFSKVALAPAFLQRFVPFTPGEPYDAAALRKLQRSLVDADYFSRADVVPRPGRAKELRVPVDVELAMRKRTRYTAGLGYGTDTGPRLSLGVERRWASRYGHRMGADMLFSSLTTEVRAHYRIPLENPNTDFLGFLASVDQTETDTSKSRTTSVGVSVTRMLDQWVRTLSLDLQRERFDVGTRSDVSQMLLPGVAWERVKADNRIFPSRGWRLRAGVKGASATLASSTDLVQGDIRGKYIYSGLGGRFVTRLDLGASEVSDFEKLPATLRFFAGGDYSIRGYAYQSLGPEDDQGNVVGGRYLAVGSVEYDRFVSQHWGLALFYDAGNAFNKVPIDVKRGAGVGLRWRLPFGLIRLDVAQALSEPGHPWRVHFTIGPEL